MSETDLIEYKIIGPRPRSNEQRSAGDDNGNESRQAPLVTCVMVTRGFVPILRHSAECFRCQTYPHRELVVVSGQDGDEVASFFRSQDYQGVKLVHAPVGLSLGSLRNMGISYASGEIIAQWDDDDLSDPNRLTYSVNVLMASGNAAAAFLSRVLIWWPARKLLLVSGERAWEGSMVGWRRAIPIYPALEKGEDTHVARNLYHDHPIALFELPLLYVYTVTGHNTCEEEHFERLLANAQVVCRDEQYDRALQHLQQRLPIYDYNEDIRRIAEAR